MDRLRFCMVENFKSWYFAEQMRELKPQTFMTTQTKRRTKKPKHITARSITLQDAKGKTRIFMDAGNGDGHVAICLFGESERSIQISTSPEGGLHISLFGNRATVSASLNMTPAEDAGLSIHDRQGRLGTMLGSTLLAGKHELVLFHEGQPCWSAPKPMRAKKKT